MSTRTRIWYSREGVQAFGQQAYWYVFQLHRDMRLPELPVEWAKKPKWMRYLRLAEEIRGYDLAHGLANRTKVGVWREKRGADATKSAFVRKAKAYGWRGRERFREVAPAGVPMPPVAAAALRRYAQVAPQRAVRFRPRAEAPAPAQAPIGVNAFRW